MKRIKEGIGSVIPVSLDFSKVLPSGQTLQAGSSITISDSNGVDTTSAMLASSALDTTKMTANIQAGAIGSHYFILFSAVTQVYTYQKKVELEVIAVT